MRATLALVLVVFATSATSARAEQQLIPSPYPSGNDGARFMMAPPSYRHQQLLPTPYARSLGPNALGNPRNSYTRRHQRLVPAPYPRQYR